MERLLQYVFDGLSFGAIYALLALGLVVVFRGTGHLNFAQGEMAMFCTFIIWQINEWGVPLALAVAEQHQGVGRAGVDLDVVALEYVAQLLHGFAVGVARGDVEFLEGELYVAGATQLEAARAEQGGQADDQQIPFHHYQIPLADHGATRRWRRAYISWRLC